MMWKKATTVDTNNSCLAPHMGWRVYGNYIGPPIRVDLMAKNLWGLQMVDEEKIKVNVKGTKMEIIWEVIS
jgi:hypothetical protein